MKAKAVSVAAVTLAFLALTIGRAVGSATVTSADIVDHTISNVDIRSGAIQTNVIHPLTLDSLQFASVRSGVTVRGVVGGDFEGFAAQVGGPCEDNCDWGADASLPFPATAGLTDSDVLVDVTLCDSDCPGIAAASSESTSAASCTGTLATPTAPAGKVCIYVAGAANAVDLAGYSVMPGTGASKYGFKLHWVSTTADDTFVDAVWAYTAP